MSEVLIIIQREFRERVRSKSFLLSTILTPLFFGAIFIIPIVFADGDDHYRIAVIDESAGGAGERITELLSAPGPAEREGVFWVDRVTAATPGLIDSLDARVEAEELDGYLRIPEGFVEEGAISYRGRNVGDLGMLAQLRGAASQAAREARLAAADLDLPEVAALMRPVSVETSRIAGDGEGADNSDVTAFFAYMLAFVLYMVILLYGAQVMQSVHEEKTNRIAEVLMSTIRAPHLMAGKIFGVGAVALLQLGIWAALLAIAISRREWIAGQLDIPPDFLAGFALDPQVGVILLLYGLLGFFLYAALFAAVGAATETMQDAQQFTWPIIGPLFVPLILQPRIAAEPNDPLALVVSWFPLTSPLGMPMRMGVTNLAAWEIMGSLVVLALGLVLIAWAAGKIYRVGILSTGKRPGFAELWRWVRTA